MNREHIQLLPDGPAPEPAVEWLLYQALAGVWPADLHTKDKAGLKALEKRFSGYVEKALREAKLRTNWGHVNEPYEHAVLSYVKGLFAADNQDFLSDFISTLKPFIRAGLVNSLTQVAIKLTASGIPDIYQGCEGHDFSLVDPDNRREPDFEALHQAIRSRQGIDLSDDQNWHNGLVKQFITKALLVRRQRAPGLFRAGEYITLETNGKAAHHFIAFARADETNAIIIIAPRLVLKAVSRAALANISNTVGKSSIRLPAKLLNRSYRSVWSGKPVQLNPCIDTVCADGMPVIALWAGTQLPGQN